MKNSSISPILPEQSKTPQELAISRLLDERWMWVTEIFEWLIDIAENAEKSTPTWDFIPDYRTRANVLKMLLEARWDFVNKSWKVNVNVGIFDMLRKWDNERNTITADDIIVWGE